MLRKKRAYSLVAILALLPIYVVATPTIAQASDPCSPSSKVAKSPNVGAVQFKNVKQSIKGVSYPAGGILLPPDGITFAGLSRRHQPLSSDQGTSVVIWHTDYNKCVNKLNAIKSAKIGDSIKVTDENGEVKNYKVTRKVSVPYGQYESDWFIQNGPRRILFVTCTGKFVNKHYTNTLVVFGSPA